MGKYRSWVRVFTDHDKYLRGAHRRRIEALRAEYVAGVAQIVADGLATDEFRATDPRVAALTVIGTLNWMSRWFRPGGRRDAASIGQEFARVVAHGVVDQPHS